MNFDDKDKKQEFRRRIGEASALPSGDPLRREVEEEITHLGTWAEEEWLALLEEAERLRLELNRVEVPYALQERLMAIPGQIGKPQNSLRKSSRISLMLKWLGAAAAIIMVFIAALWMANFPLLNKKDLLIRNEKDLQNLALLAMNHHLTDHPVTIQTTDSIILAKELSNLMPFSVKIPDLGSELHLVGGTPCSLDSHPVACCLWKGPGGKYSLIQFRLDDFALSPQPKRKLVHQKWSAPGEDGYYCEAMAWTDGERGYILVGHLGSLVEKNFPPLMI